jgi:signal transduction histidine kinase
VSRLENTPRDIGDSVEGSSEPPLEEFASSITDLAKLCEDSVNVVAAAHQHHTGRPDLSLHRIQPQSNGILQNGVVPPRPASVNMVLNIRPGSWNFLCLPGAIQRIIMNLAGNSLKYTQSGSIQVDLFIEATDYEVESQQKPTTDQRTIVLKVSDTGKGITNEFLKTRLFTPFSQESTLAPGTGKQWE